MYIPSFNSFTDGQEIVAFMQRYSFATIITQMDGVPVATHLPFLVKEENDKLTLQAHFAKANPQWKEIEGNTSLVIFTEPHAYISPNNYGKVENVPTWNYIAVHAYGKAHILDDIAQKTELLKHTINAFESAYLQQWESLPEQYRLKMMNGIVAFEIEVTDLQAKRKLSQNRSEQEQTNIINSLSQSPDANEREIAAYMSKLPDGQSK
ncbi:FMN-binding negative transcriptional regulator [Mucilaginibacter sp. BT774]|uniref:FMN-binding negative transcriptional regulator n=1 Tax=Mucilaginibacter sp. BT774 TaxID=3062276 RepID=UPI0026757202|nr:FMN-binding negative transcriptional regulator [Mucilaginibacter sp. BT774]MDO3625189.1 FMN-binding negative transcriptional regulator [Mucilaginibacter sp. BT774]